jgi:hypothetical protein
VLRVERVAGQLPLEIYCPALLFGQKALANHRTRKLTEAAMAHMYICTCTFKSSTQDASVDISSEINLDSSQ